MTKDEFVAKEVRAATMFMEALDIVEALMNVNEDLSAELLLDPVHTQCGAAFQAVINTLGTGSASNRAKINRLRL